MIGDHSAGIVLEASTLGVDHRIENSRQANHQPVEVTVGRARGRLVRNPFLECGQSHRERRGLVNDRCQIDVSAAARVDVARDAFDLRVRRRRDCTAAARVREPGDRRQADANILCEQIHVGLVERIGIGVPPPRVRRATGPRPPVGMSVRQERVGRERRRCRWRERTGRPLATVDEPRASGLPRHAANDTLAVAPRARRSCDARRRRWRRELLANRCCSRRDSAPARSVKNVSAYHVEPLYRPCEWPGHQQMRTPRSRSLRRSQSSRAISIMHASPVALSVTPTSQAQ